MTIIENDTFKKLINDIWLTVLSLQTHPTQETMISDQSSYCGSVQISGDWCGGVAVQTTEAHARYLASIAYGKKLNEVDTSEVSDIIGEIANILGGNIKGLIPASCNLSLPTVTTGNFTKFDLPEYDILLSAMLESEGQPIKVIFFKKTNGNQ